jgi:hypothetical protein
LVWEKHPSKKNPAGRDIAFLADFPDLEYLVDFFDRT